MGKVIYEKSYPRESLEEAIAQMKSNTRLDKDVVPPSMEFLKEMHENRVYVPIPARVKMTKCLIEICQLNVNR